MIKKPTQSLIAVALGLGCLTLGTSAHAMNFGDMMNPSKWMGGGPGGWGGGPGYGYGGPGGYR